MRVPLSALFMIIVVVTCKLVHAHSHEGFGVSAQRVLQQVGQRGVAEGHVVALLGATHDHVTERREGLVDGLEYND